MRTERTAEGPDALASDGPSFEIAPRESFTVFYARELRPVVGLAFVLSGSALAAEDLAQDAFFDAYRKWSTVGEYDNPGAWVRRAVANRAVSLRRRTATELGSVLRLRRADVEIPGPSPDNEQLWAAVRRLPRRQAQVVVLHHLEQYTTTEIAETLGISQPSVKTHLQRARATLSKGLEN
jgi:RNA polymerase sigma-70 factor (ECF subfamily)